jgi:hypothetical protein
MAISPRGDYLAIGDSIGQVQLLTSHDLSVESDLIGSDGMLSLPPLNGYDHGSAVDWPDLPLPLPNIKWSNRTYVILANSIFQSAYKALFTGHSMLLECPITTPHYCQTSRRPITQQHPRRFSIRQREFHLACWPRCE